MSIINITPKSGPSLCGAQDGEGDRECGVAKIAHQQLSSPQETTSPLSSERISPPPSLRRLETGDFSPTSFSSVDDEEVLYSFEEQSPLSSNSSECDSPSLMEEERYNLSTYTHVFRNIRSDDEGVREKAQEEFEALEKGTENDELGRWTLDQAKAIVERESSPSAGEEGGLEMWKTQELKEELNKLTETCNQVDPGDSLDPHVLKQLDLLKQEIWKREALSYPDSDDEEDPSAAQFKKLEERFAPIEKPPVLLVSGEPVIQIRSAPYTLETLGEGWEKMPDGSFRYRFENNEKFEDDDEEVEIFFQGLAEKYEIR